MIASITSVLPIIVLFMVIVVLVYAALRDARRRQAQAESTDLPSRPLPPGTVRAVRGKLAATLVLHVLVSPVYAIWVLLISAATGPSSSHDLYT